MKMSGPAINQAADRPVGTGTDPGRLSFTIAL
jgi:hypothetical protein